MAVDVNIPEEQKNLSGEKLPKVMQVPVSWTDFDLVRSGSTALLEEKHRVMRIGSPDWQDRKWGLFDFKRINNIASANTERHPGTSPGNR